MSGPASARASRGRITRRASKASRRPRLARTSPARVGGPAAARPGVDGIGAGASVGSRAGVAARARWSDPGTAGVGAPAATRASRVGITSRAGEASRRPRLARTCPGRVGGPAAARPRIRRIASRAGEGGGTGVTGRRTRITTPATRASLAGIAGRAARRTGVAARARPRRTGPARMAAPAATRAGGSSIVGRAGVASRTGVAAGHTRPLRASRVRVSGVAASGRPCSQPVVIKPAVLPAPAGFPFLPVLGFRAVLGLIPVIPGIARYPAHSAGPRRRAVRNRGGGIGFVARRAAAATQVAIPVIFVIGISSGARLRVRLPPPAARRRGRPGWPGGPRLARRVAPAGPGTVTARPGISDGRRVPGCPGRPSAPRIAEALTSGPGVRAAACCAVLVRLAIPGIGRRRPGVVLRCTRPAQFLLVLRPPAAHRTESLLTVADVRRPGMCLIAVAPSCGNNQPARMRSGTMARAPLPPAAHRHALRSRPIAHDRPPPAAGGRPDRRIRSRRALSGGQRWPGILPPGSPAL